MQITQQEVEAALAEYKALDAECAALEARRDMARERWSVLKAQTTLDKMRKV